jgi:MoaA/NifB/PqqE/SkfB family radical SAM enzyme
MRLRDIGPAWSKILRGHKPLLSLEITKECPLRCPGCYAYEESHLGSSGPLRQLKDYKGAALIAAVLALVRRLRPLHVSIVGGEPLVRYQELSVLLPKLAEMKVEVQLVTSAVRPIPAEWRGIRGLHIVVSIDGLQPEHDARRSPATYERILKNISGQQITVHCTITRPQIQRPGYLAEFADFWSNRQQVRNIWFSLFTPQEGEQSPERLTDRDRRTAVRELAELRDKFPKVKMPSAVLDGYARPPASPRECIFAQTTTCVSADLTTRIAPCQFGGQPVCSECGCMASAGLAAIGRHRLGGLIQVSNIFDVSRRLGEQYTRWASQP